jgi:hypothetical protein
MNAVSMSVIRDVERMLMENLARVAPGVSCSVSTWVESFRIPDHIKLSHPLEMRVESLKHGMYRPKGDANVLQMSAGDWIAIAVITNRQHGKVLLQITRNSVTGDGSVVVGMNPNNQMKHPSISPTRRSPKA